MRDLQARIEVKNEVMQLQFVVEAKIQEAVQLRGCLNDIAPNARSALKFSVEEVCRSATVTPTATCRSRLVGHLYRVQAPGRFSSPALRDIARRRKQEPAAPDVEQVQRLA